jgi:hypothetical protein
MKIQTFKKTWDFHSDEDSGYGLLGYYTML